VERLATSRRRFAWLSGIAEPPWMDVRIGRHCVELGPDGLLGAGGGCPPGAPVLGDTILMPGLCNGHVHLPDAAVADAGEELGLHELVAQPSGLKYRLLDATRPGKVMGAVGELLHSYRREGVLVAGAYVEPGFLKPVAEAARRAGVLLRTFAQPGEKRLPEVLELLTHGSWVGLDTPLDLELWEMRIATQLASQLGLHVAAHVSEDEPLARVGDLGAALAGGIDVAIHLTHVGPGDALEAARRGVSLVYCPLANLYYTGTAPDPRSLLSLHAERAAFALGSDNAAWPPQGMGLVIAAAYTVYRPRLAGTEREALARALLYAATAGCGRALGAETGWQLRRVPLISYSYRPTVGLAKRLHMSVLEAVVAPPRLL